MFSIAQIKYKRSSKLIFEPLPSKTKYREEKLPVGKK